MIIQGYQDDLPRSPLNGLGATGKWWKYGDYNGYYPYGIGISLTLLSTD